MLAQNFMTARELGIADDLRWALVKVLGQLERGELEHLKVSGKGVKTEKSPTGFNMNYWGEKAFNCGTPACLGGWAFAHMDRSFGTLVTDTMPRALDKLFRPGMEKGVFSLIDDYDVITPAQAACALRSYLTVGQPCWVEALAS